MRAARERIRVSREVASPRCSFAMACSANRSPPACATRSSVVAGSAISYRTGTVVMSSAQQAALLHLTITSMKGQLLTRTAPELCGRILAVLEETQEKALGTELNRGVIASYGAASTTPHLSFPRLLQRRNAHLTRLRRDATGSAVHLDRTLGLLMSELLEDGGCPPLSPAGQAEFALGYFHQRQERFQPKNPSTITDPAEDSAT